MTTTDLINGAIRIVQDLPAHAERLAGWALSTIWWVALTVIGVCIAAAAARGFLSRARLAERTALEVVPTAGFAPEADDVVRFARHIVRAHKSVSRWIFTSPRSIAIRIHFATSGGPLTMRVEGPAKALSVLRHQGYAQCEMRPSEAGGTPSSERPRIQLGVPPRTGAEPTTRRTAER
ncbi:hypothetical protein [Streptomyces sp. NPDC096339]|uniref:hypothetical protein n=1 Tax=Streptomyces sp. NPDC096339 TaxID=3366086 RepID=UPI0037F50868